MQFFRTRATLLVLIALAMLAPMRAAQAQGFIANQLESLLSTDNAQVKIEGLSGAISGSVRIESLTVADPDGVYLTARDLALDWSPTALIRRTIEIQKLSAGSIELSRLPAASTAAEEEDEEDSGGFSLPNITANVQEISVGSFTLGEAVAGMAAQMSANGSLHLTPSPAALSVQLAIERQDQPGAINANIAFAPGENRLDLNIEANEPQGGIIAGLLKLPDSPPVTLAVTSNGPLSDFTATGTLDIDTERAITLDARVQDAAEGRQITVDVSSITQPFVPAAYAGMVGETAGLAADVLMRNEGGIITINRGQLVSGALQLDASGTYDPQGDSNDLRLMLATEQGNPVALAFGELGARSSVEISTVEASLTGALANAALNVSARARTAGYEDYLLRDLDLRASSAGFDLNTIAGPFQLALNSAAASGPEGVAGNVLTGPVALTLDGAVSEQEITIAANSLTTGTASAAVTGRAARDFSTFDFAIRSDVESVALAEALADYAGERVSLRGQVARTDAGFTGQDIVLESTGLTIQAAGSLNGEAIEATAAGSMDQSRLPDSGQTGRADFNLDAGGTLAAPEIDLIFNGADIDISGRTLEEINGQIQGTFAPEAPNGTVALDGRFNSVPLALNADFETAGGVRHLRNLDLTQGDNRITGELALDAANIPAGTLDINAPDVGSLAALAGQEASGELIGTLNFAAGNGAPQANFDITSNALSFGETELVNAVIDLALFDYMERPQAEGRIEAASISTASITVAATNIGLTRLNDATVIDGTTTVNDVPARLNGTVAVADGETRIDLRQLTADVPDAAIALREPVTITLGQNGTTIGQTLLAVGNGALTLAGSVADEVTLNLDLDALPLAVANPFVADLDAAGTLSGALTTAGPADDLRADFNVALAGLQTSQTRQAQLPAVEGTVAGRYRGGIASLETGRLTLGSGTLDITGDIGETLDAVLTLTDIPVALANGFVDGLDASGTISGRATATGPLDNPVVDFDVDGRDISEARIAAAGTGPMTLDVSGRMAQYTVRFSDAVARLGDGAVRATGSVGRDLDLKVDLDTVPVALANAFVSGLNARGAISGSATATGTLGNPEASFQLAGDNLTADPLRQSGVETVALDAAGAYRDQTLTIERGNLRAGNGTLDISGSVGDTLNVQMAMQQLPLALANAASPSLGARGSVSGTASATGTLDNPSASFDISGNGISVAAARAAGAPEANLTAAGQFANETVTLQTARIDLAGGGNIVATGSAGQRLNLDVTLNGVPASIAAAAAPDVAPQGTIGGNVQARGTISQPDVKYDLRVDALSVAQTREAGVGPLDIAAQGAYAQNRVTLDGNLAGSGINFNTNGSVNLAGTPAFDLALNGNAPLSLANRILAEGGRSIQGEVTVNARVAGTAASPNVTGTVTTAGARFVDTGVNLAVENINTTINLSGDRATISAFSATLGSGGSIDVSGGLGLSGGFPADIIVTIRDGRYSDGELVSTRLNADLTLTGPVTGAAVLGGTINAQEVTIVVPDNLPGSLAEIDVRHINAPEAVYRQQREINPDQGGNSGSSSGMLLDLTLNAPNRVFVRGRGLDLELGGTIQVSGPASNPGIVGGFDLERGRLQILSRRLEFERASLSFTGDLVPTLDFLAEADTGDATVYVAVTGPAQNPAFTFTSTPILPQDEVLARLIFGQATSDLSPLQIAQLASAAASLAGVGGSSGLLDSLRNALGVDDIDIRTTADGQAAVGVGQYLNENTYVGVDSTGRVSIDLELGRDIKARGAVTSSGGGEVGVFYEKEY